MKKENLPYAVFSKSVLYLYSLFLLIPMYFVIITSFKSRQEIVANPLGLPAKLLFGNFKDAFIEANLARCGLNSIVITTLTVALVLLFNTLIAFGIYRTYHKRFGTFFYSVLIAGLMIPSVGYVSTIILYRQLHLYNNLMGLIGSNVAGSIPFSMFILVGFLRSVPRQLEEAATIDGCSDLQCLIHILIPIIRPALATIAIFYMVGSWNNLLGPLLLLKNRDLYTIPVGLLNFRSSNSIDYNYLFAGVLITSLPVLIFYLLCQKNFVKSLAGSVKA